MTGVQYRRFMGSGDWSAWWHRIQRIPVIFDDQYLPVGTALLTAGIPVVLRHHWRLGLFLLLYIAGNAFHGVYYSVGDYAVYYLPAVFACALFLGVGLWWLLRWCAERPPRPRRTLVRAYLGGAAAVTGALLMGYVHLTKRVPAWLSPRGYTAVGVVLVILGAIVLTRAIRRRRQDARRRPLGATILPRLVLASVALVVALTAGVRAHRFALEKTYGSAYGQELATEIPPGSVLLVLGDGYLFSMWYQAHVAGRGTDVVTIDIGNHRTPWYTAYLYSRFPRSCDPLAERFVADPAAYQQECGTFRKRIDKGDSRSWTTLGHKAGARGRKPVKVTQPILRGADQRCADPEFFKAHTGKECRCYKLGKETGVVETDCGHSYDEGGIVPLDGWEVVSHRIIEDQIRKRPVFERHVFTFWDKGKNNPRLWNGPRHQRPSGVYSMVNRGRYNQIVHYTTIASFDPCASETFVELPSRPTRVTAKRARQRARYLPNPRPTLIESSALSDRPRARSHESTRSFHAGDGVYLKLAWFEKWYYDAKKKGRRGDPIHHGLRVCFYDPDGRRVALKTLVTNAGDNEVLWQSSVSSKPGSYRVRACSIGELDSKDAVIPDTAECVPTILDYGFTLYL